MGFETVQTAWLAREHRNGAFGNGIVPYLPPVVEFLHHGCFLLPLDFNVSQIVCRKAVGNSCVWWKLIRWRALLFDTFILVNIPVVSLTVHCTIKRRPFFGNWCELRRRLGNEGN